MAEQLLPVEELNTQNEELDTVDRHQTSAIPEISLNTQEKPVDVQGLAEHYNIAPSWVYGETRKKGTDTIPCIRVGKYLRFFISEVESWLRRKQEGREEC